MTFPKTNELEEAATVRNRARRMLKDAEALLQDKTLPATMRKGLESLRSGLRKTWKDLNDEASTDEPASTEAAEEYYGDDYYPISYYSTSGATSYADLEAVRQAAIAANRIRELTYLFPPMALNIIRSGGSNRVRQLRSLAEELLDLVEDELDAVQEPQRIGDATSETLAEAEITEASSAVVSIAEAQPGGDIVPLMVDVQLIRPGPGNSRDRHYYSADMLKQNARVFEGVKMFESDHRPNEKSTRTWVSTVKEIKGFTNEGAPIGRVVVHNRDFAERLMALNKAGMLNLMECSILAEATARPGRVDGQDYKIIESITKAKSVDWVTRAGAGGQALQISESDEGTMEENENTNLTEDQPETVAISEADQQQQEQPKPQEQEQQPQQPQQPQQQPQQPQQPQQLSEADVLRVLLETNLPKAARVRLAKAAYAKVEELQEAIKDETAYLKEVAGSGRPFAQGAGAEAPATTTMTEAEYDKEYEAIITRYIG